MNNTAQNAELLPILPAKKLEGGDWVVALAGNPNVGKSTVFNQLTGLNQHTGNWPGKTVASAHGRYEFQKEDTILVDLPGTYSLVAHSAEEEVARDFLVFGGADVTVVVCDATCLERNMNLVLQTLEISPSVVVFVNLLDEAKKKGISVDLKGLEKELGVIVVGGTARSGKGLHELKVAIHSVAEKKTRQNPRLVRYLPSIEAAIDVLTPVLAPYSPLSPRYLALGLLSGDNQLLSGILDHTGLDIQEDPEVIDALIAARQLLVEGGLEPTTLGDKIVSCIVLAAEEVCMENVTSPCNIQNSRDRKIDRILTSPITGIPVMLMLLGGIFWLTITGANYPSAFLSELFSSLEGHLLRGLQFVSTPPWLYNALVLGVYRTVSWVVAVMLPPMAIFFPLFTLLEDFGYLPRVAFNLDHHFKKAKACGKQALTMAMGFGCNAVGVVGCRIIDSPRERLIAIITNCFVPCNGRFPTLIAIITMFFVGESGGFGSTLFSALLLTLTILLGVTLTFIVSRLLSETLLKGEPTSFTLELPPYRTPQFGRVILRSLIDRTAFVLGRAVVVAAPAGLIIYGLANISVDGITLLSHCAGFLDPFASLLGLDGVILLAFILGFPANEIVIPIMVMTYMSSGALSDFSSLTELKVLLVQNGWTWVTAVSTMLFCLIHYPCSTTCLTIKKETGSLKWTALSIALPTLIGMGICFVFASAVRVLGFI